MQKTFRICQLTSLFILSWFFVFISLSFPLWALSFSFRSFSSPSLVLFSWIACFFIITSNTKKVKEGTKGQKQIATENQGTIVFYRDMMLGASAVYLIGMMVFSTFTKSDIFFILFSVISHAGCYKFMEYMSRAKYSSSGQLLDGGVDLNMQGGVAESVKDVIILTSSCQIFSLYSNYFWLLWLLVPIWGLVMLRKNILSPYLSDQGQNNSEANDKKQKKKKKKSKWVKLV